MKDKSIRTKMIEEIEYMDMCYTIPEKVDAIITLFLKELPRIKDSRVKERNTPKAYKWYCIGFEDCKNILKEKLNDK